MGSLEAILEMEDIHSYYGNIQVLKGLSLQVNEGDIVTLVGNNGAGKTTTLNTISGLLAPRSGKITFNGERIDRLEPHRIVRMGISQVPEGRKVFARLTVKENLELGAFTRGDGGGDQKRHASRL